MGYHVEMDTKLGYTAHLGANAELEAARIRADRVGRKNGREVRIVRRHNGRLTPIETRRPDGTVQPATDTPT